MKTYITTKRTMPARVDRMDTLSQFYFKTGLWMMSPWWFIKELIKSFFRGGLWLHKRGTDMETRKVAFGGCIITFATTVERMVWLDEINYFQSQPFKNEMVRRRKELDDKKAAKKLKEELSENLEDLSAKWEMELNGTRLNF